MENILLTISYDGTDFCGWQRQDKSDHGKSVRTVQAEMEKALEKMFRTKINLHGSGRTDSGVHAHGQAANFFAPVDGIPRDNYLRALNGLLPPDIRVMDACVREDGFSSRFSATSRVYRYFMRTETFPEARDSRYVWHIKNRPDLAVLNSYAGLLKGELDCASFAAAGDASVSTCRYIDDAFFYYDEKSDDTLVFQIEANAFLWKMVRTLTGTLITLEQRGASQDDFRKIIESRDRTKALITAPPTGLFLWEIKFDGVRRHV